MNTARIQSRRRLNDSVKTSNIPSQDRLGLSDDTSKAKENQTLTKHAKENVKENIKSNTASKQRKVLGELSASEIQARSAPHTIDRTEERRAILRVQEVNDENSPPQPSQVQHLSSMQRRRSVNVDNADINTGARHIRSRSLRKEQPTRRSSRIVMMTRMDREKHDQVVVKQRITSTHTKALVSKT
jgi:hypothetical protein